MLVSWLPWRRVVAALSALAACSTLPPASQPAHLDHHVAAAFVVPANGRLVLPASSERVVVRELHLEPAPLAEHFRDTVRWFDYAPGTHVMVHGRFRTWSADGAPPASASELLAGARTITTLAP